MQDEFSVLIADVYEAAGALKMSGDAIASAEGVSLTQWHLMDSIVDSEVTVARAARRIGLTRQAVQRVANELVDRGLIVFRENPDHKTSPLLELTVEGKAVQQRLWERATASHQARFASLTREQIDVTREALRQITEATYAVHGTP